MSDILIYCIDILNDEDTPKNILLVSENDHTLRFDLYENNYSYHRFHQTTKTQEELFNEGYIFYKCDFSDDEKIVKTYFIKKNMSDYILYGRKHKHSSVLY